MQTKQTNQSTQSKFMQGYNALRISEGPILIDVDSVLADWLAHMVNSINKSISEGTLGRVALEGIVKDPSKDLLEVDHITSRGFLFQHSRLLATATSDAMDDHDFWSSLPAFPGVQESVSELREYRQIAFVTAPWFGCQTWLQARYDWLKDFELLEKGDFLIPTHDKHLITGSVLIEDNPDALYVWQKTHNRSRSSLYLIDGAHNRDDDTLPRYRNFNEATEVLVHRLKKG